MYMRHTCYHMLYLTTMAILATFFCASMAGCSDDDTTNAGGFVFRPSIAGSELRIAAFNAEDFSSNAVTGAGTYATVAAFVATNKIDIIMICESEPYDRDRLTAALDRAGVSMTNRITTSNAWLDDADDIFDDEVSLWSRFPITHFSQVVGKTYCVDPVSLESVSAPRFILRIRVDVGGKDFWFYGAHLKAADADSDRKRRRAQAHALEEYIKANHDEKTERIVICGDMNTITPSVEFVTNGTLGYLELKSDDASDTANNFVAVNKTLLPLPDGYTWRSPSWPSASAFADAILDHLILSPALYAKYVPGSVKILLRGATPRISDHFPIMLTVSLQ